jgi:nucleotide-binding universal stress UspA family protein
MFRKVLVPVDLTEKNNDAVDAAAELAGREGNVTLLHVIEAIEGPFDELQEFYQRLEKKAQGTLTELARRVGARTASVQQVVCYGKRAAEIVVYARENGFDLIVITSHRVDPNRAAESLMTISHQVAILADVPVLVLR